MLSHSASFMVKIMESIKRNASPEKQCNNSLPACVLLHKFTHKPVCYLPSLLLDHEYGNTFFRIFDNVPFSISLSALGALQLMIVLKNNMIKKKKRRKKRIQKNWLLSSPGASAEVTEKMLGRMSCVNFHSLQLYRPEADSIMPQRGHHVCQKVAAGHKTFYIFKTFPTFMKESIRGRKSMMGPAVAATSRGCQIRV